ncbi:hypothetical protein FJZ31_15060 [Candidatus Poribacteria bacterium]|nr:hypothetical protein [Candidatus Poribacteria bacterium]
MKSQAVILTLVGLSLMVVGLVLAHDDTCNEATVQALKECVKHASEEGHIDNSGITKSLLAKLDAAESAVKKNQLSAAINMLEAFIHEVEAQAGKHIEEQHAQHMVEHAERVKDELS